MLPLLIAAAASAAAGAASSRASGKAASRAADKAEGYIQRIKVPTLEEARAQLESYIQQGILTPQQAEAILQESSAYSEIQEDPRLREAQIDALSELGGVVDADGMDARFREALLNSRDEQLAASRGSQDAIMANARARGISGSNLESVNRLMAGQAAATRSAARGVEAASAAEERRMGALRDRAGLAGAVRNTDYQMDANEAAARDSINRFNTGARQAAADANVRAANNAQAVNLGERQRIADANTKARNDMITNVQDMDYRKRVAQANAANNVGTAQVADAQRAAAAGQGASQAVGSLFDAYLKSQQGGQTTGSTGQLTSDERAKTDVKPFDPRKLLDDVSGVTFRYKDPSEGEGQMAGVMAQDVEKAAPGAVSTRPDGMKQIDSDQLGGILLAALSDVHKRLKNVEASHAR